jgi:hypothetical protein
MPTATELQSWRAIWNAQEQNQIRHDLDTISRALCAAEDEIHNPGCARANNYDVLDLIDQARTILKRAMTERPAS